MDPFPADALTDDAFLGGRLRILQPKSGYRAGVDPVLLAAGVDARRGEEILELGCGTGVAALCLAARVPGVRVTGLERQAAYAALARRNAERNGLRLEVVEGDLAAMPAELRARQFDHVIANPPYFDRRRGTAARDAGREAALGEETPLGAWLAAAARRLRPGGRLSVIQRAERLADLFAGMPATLGGLVLRPVAPRVGRDATLVLVQTRKGSRAAMRLAAPFVLHDGLRHEADGDDYSAAARAVLRDGAALPRD